MVDSASLTREIGGGGETTGDRRHACTHLEPVRLPAASEDERRHDDVCLGPVSGLASDADRIGPITFPRVCAVVSRSALAHLPLRGQRRHRTGFPFNPNAKTREGT
jgi:hypothetical protein